MQPDFVVIGGGPAGASAAIGLAIVGARVRLLERSRSPAFKPGEIVEPTVRYPLAELGLLNRFEGLGFLPIAGNLSVWGGWVAVNAESIVNPHGAGYLVDRQCMESWLLREAAAAGVVISTGVRHVEVVGGRRPLVTWSEGDCKCAARPALVVEAIGRSSVVVGAGEREHLDNLVAVLAYSQGQPERKRDQRLLIEAYSSGWWYSAPLPGGRCVIACMTDADRVPSSNKAQQQWLGREVGNTLYTAARMAADPPSQLFVRPASSSRRMVVAGDGWVAVGDAAATYDPLSGRGVAAAVTKGVGLARAIASASDLDRATRSYADAERVSFIEYVAQWHEMYRREQRWPDASFWSRRHH